MPSSVFAIAAFALVGGATALWFRRVRRVDIPANRIVFVAAWAGGAALGAVAIASGSGWTTYLPAGLALVAGAVLTVLVGISRQIAAPDAIATGDAMPDFEAIDERGARFVSSRLAGKPALIKFFRGHW